MAAHEAPAPVPPWTGWLGDALRIAAVRLRDPLLAEDAVQEACADALRVAPPGHGGVDGMRAWFLTLVINRCRMALRARQRRDHHTAAAGAALPASVAAPDHDLGEALRAALDILPEHEREPVELRYLGGLDYAAIARSLGRREKTVRSQVDRGLERLRATIARVGLAAGGPAALGLLLSALPAPAPSAELTTYVVGLPAPTVAPAATAPLLGVLAAGGMAAAVLAGVLLARPAQPPPPAPPAATAGVAGVPALPAPPAASPQSARFSGPGVSPFTATGSLSALALSPDGTRLAWCAWLPQREMGLMAMADGRALAPPVLPAGARPFLVQWIDDRRLAVLVRQQPDGASDEASDHDWPSVLHVLPLDGGAGAALTLPRGTRPYSMACSPDGRALAFAVGADGPVGANCSIGVVDTATLTLTRHALTEPGSGRAVYKTLVGSGIVAAVLSGSMDNRRPDRDIPVGNGELVVLAREDGRELLRRVLPWSGSHIHGLVMDGERLVVRAVEDAAGAVSAMVDPLAGTVDRRPGWTLASGWTLSGHRVLGPGTTIELGHAFDLQHVVSDERHVILGRDWRVEVFAVADGRPRVVADRLASAPDDLGWSGDGRLLIRCGDELLAWGAAGPTRLASGRVSQWNPFAIGTGRVAVGAAGCREMLLFDAEGALLARHRRPDARAEQASFAPDGGRLAFVWQVGEGAWTARQDAAPAEIVLHRAADGARLLPLALRAQVSGRQLRLAWSAAGDTLYVAGTGDDHQTGGAYDTTTGARRWSPANADGAPLSEVIALLPLADGHVLAVRGPAFAFADEDDRSETLLLDGGDGRLRRALPASPGRDTVATADGERAVGRRAAVRLADGAVLARWPGGVAVWPSPSATRCAWIADGVLVIVDTRGDARLRCRIPLPDAGGTLSYVAWSADEQRLALAWSDRLEPLVVDPFAATAALTPAAAVDALDGDDWSAAVGALVAAGEAGAAALAARAVDGRTVAVLEGLALRGDAAAAARLRALVDDPAAGGAARDALLRHRPAQLAPLSVPVPPAPAPTDF